MVFRQSRVDGQRGFTLVELMIVIAIIGIISMMATPLFMTFLRASETRGASQELAALLHQARELAIARNTDYRVEIEPDNNRLRFVRTSDNVVWTGPGTDGQGYRRLVNQARLTNPTANPTFNRLGTAGGGTITVQNSQGTSALDVVVASSGRIRIE
ncbi:type II secretion system protein GspH [Candidatus Methylomirabilis limnetica]|uniref:Type II secretion system protein GspH n=1 Tax=Candidatus Methylomirabilis limnetica TaxID=2033718 RepID=A0A2T4TVF1_9BACT|nr:GspH/FimT family pseudopilin [Candidatus Methylomirabilis limnetica]PTL35094.1 type II secretion system protein GspH [Candidatus Methylomirabilis limnetica]